MPFGPVARFDHGWFHLMYSRTEYLFPSRWRLTDWAHASVPLATLAVGAVAGTEPLMRKMCASALVLGLCGLAISLAGADLLQIVIVAQAQPWRWLWLTNAMAVILIPLIFRDCWRAGDAARAGALLLAAAWVCIDEKFVLLIVPIAIAVAAFAGRVSNPRIARLMLGAATIVLIIGLLVLVGFVRDVQRDLASIAPDRAVFTSRYLLALRHWKVWQAGGIAPFAVFLGAWWVAVRKRSLCSALAVLVLGVALCAAFAEFAWNSWTRADISANQYQAFAPWRRAIPPSAQVLWVGGSAYPTWFVLERPSYWSRTQMAASVFSEKMARALALREYVLTGLQVTNDPAADLVRLCRANPPLAFLVNPADMGPTPYPVVVIRQPDRVRLRLYRCADYRR